MSDRHVIIGSGPVGRATAAALRERGAEVVLASRSGRQDTAAVDATDPEALTRLTEGAVALYNCVNPPSYDVWPQVWPPVAAGLLAAAERTRGGAGDRRQPLPLRPRAGRRDARGHARRGHHHEGTAPRGDDPGRLRPARCRPDPRGRGARDRTTWAPPWATTDTSRASSRAPCRARASPSSGAPTSRTPGPTCVTWARPWPCSPRRSRHGGASGTHPATHRARRHRQSTTCSPASARVRCRVRALPTRMLGLLAPFVPVMGELRETAYQFTAPYVMESSAITAAYGLEPSPWEDVCRRTVG